MNAAGPGSTRVDQGQPTDGARHDDALLTVTGLQKHFPIYRGVLRRQVGAVRAVDGIDLSVARGQTLGLVGESGCGKTTTGRMLTRLIEPTAGSIVFDGLDITHLSMGRMRPLRKDIQLIFQDPYSSLNPRHTVGAIVGAPFELQKVHTEHGTKRAVQDLLELVGLNPEHYNRYPHEFSGGQRQRIGIARSLALRPKLVIADEPVSALDVSIQAQVINLLEDLQNELGLTYVVIAHDLSVVRHIADRVAVMYLGKIVEVGDRTDVYERPKHPYTVALLSAVPLPDPRRRTRGARGGVGATPDAGAGSNGAGGIGASGAAAGGNGAGGGPGVGGGRIRLQGDPPNPADPPPACRFHTRCWKAQEVCRTVEPPLEELAPGQFAACHFPENLSAPAAGA